MSWMSYYLGAGVDKPTAEQVYEVIAALNAQGLTNEKIASALGVKSTVIAAYKGRAEELRRHKALAEGEKKPKSKYYLPNKQQYHTLVAMLAPKLPGEEFHHRTVFKSLQVTLPENWEEQMVFKAVYEQAPAYQISLDSFEGLEKNHFESFLKKEARTWFGYREPYGLAEQLDTLKTAIDLYEERINQAEEERREYNEDIERQLNSIPSYIMQSTECGELLNEVKAYLRPHYQDGSSTQEFAEDILQGEIDRLRKSYAIIEHFPEMHNEEIESSVFELAAIWATRLEQKLQKHNEKVDSIKVHRKLIGNYNEVVLAELEEYHWRADSTLGEFCLFGEKLFDQKQLTVYLSEQDKVTIDLQAAFKAWVMSSDSGLQMHQDEEEVLLSGRLIHSVADNHVSFEIYQLDSGFLKLIKNFDNIVGQATVLIDVANIKVLVDEFSELGYEHQIELKEVLMRYGYLYPGVRAIV